MTHTRTHSLFPLSVLIAALAMVAPAGAQTKASPSPSPSPAASPSASPVVIVEPVIVDVDTEVDADAIEADVEQAMAASRREIERSTEMMSAHIARGAQQAARSLARGSVSTRGVSAEAAVAVERAMEEAFAAVDAAREEMQGTQEEQREKELEARERARARERAARDRARDAEREKRHAAREQHQDAEHRAEELYEQAMESIDEEDWNDALRPLERLMSLNHRLDAALYWTGYSQGKLNRTASALATLARLQKEYPTSRWAREAKALEMEVRGKSGQTPRPDQQEDLDLKLMAVSALAQSDPKEAMPMLANLLSSPTASRRVRERSLFVLAQMGSDEAGLAIAEVARGNRSPELQRKAIQYLGVFGGPGNRKILSDVYSSTTDNTLRKQILNSFMVSGDKARVLNAAKTEKDPALRTDAVRLLGVMGGSSELSQMYPTATTADEKKAILNALFLSGASGPIANAARGEKDKEARLAAVRYLGLMGRGSEGLLSEMYRAETEFEVKKSVLNAFFLQGNSTRLVEIARAEKDPVLKKEAVHWLSLMNSRESRAFMLELLK